MFLTMVIFILIIQLPDTLRSQKSGITKFTTIQSREIDHEFSLDASKMRYKNRLTALPSKSEHSFSISIITAASTKQRFSSLVRLCDSLVKAYYSGRTNIRLLFNIDVGTSAEVIEYVNRFVWPHGPKTVHVRVEKGGLVSAVAESWYPSSPEDHGIILEDDIEVSPYFFVYLLKVLDAHYADPDPRLIGISLYTPRAVEHIAGRSRFHIDPASTFTGNLYGQTLPCSWGALWLPSGWTNFLAYMSTRLEAEEEVTIEDTTVSVPGSLTMYWARSWKKYMTEIMYTHDLFMVYPNLPNQVSFSTNHVELGEHIVSEKDRGKRLADFTVPLLQEDSLNGLKEKLGKDPLAFPSNLRDINMLDIYSRPIVDLECLIDDECTAKYPPQMPSPSSVLNRLWSSRRNHVCQNIPFNDNYLMKEDTKLTLVIDSGVNCDLEILAGQLKYYSNSAKIIAILVVWNDTSRPPPPSVRIGNLFVSFLPQFESSIHNRFNPSSKIITDGVMVVDLGVKVHLDDIHEAYNLWSDFPNNIVGFTSIRIKKSADSYIGVRSNVMILHSRFLKMYSCDEGMAYIHYQVEKLGGCEDLALSMFVSIDTKYLSPLLFTPRHRLVRFTSLHQHPQPNTECIEVLSQYFYRSSNPPAKKLQRGTNQEMDELLCTKVQDSSVGPCNWSPG